MCVGEYTLAEWSWRLCKYVVTWALAETGRLRRGYSQDVNRGYRSYRTVVQAGVMHVV